ncbi:MAG: S-layer homology domain-containing protein [Gemmatimonadota bacterium]|nr:S-layer homology domain-containing protein [Gemmatimonadota bacterium]
MFERDNERHGRGRLRTALAVAAVTAVVASMAIVGTVAAQPGQRFSDVPRTHYAYTSIEWAVTNGITQGCGDGRNFCPADTLNRAQMVTFLKRYHDTFHGTTSSGSGGSGGSGNSDDPIEFTLREFGTDEESVTLPEGRYRVEFTLEHDMPLVDDFVSVRVTVEDADGRDETLITQLFAAPFSSSAESFTSRATFDVGERLGQLDPGKIYFNVTLTPQNANNSRAPWAEWEIEVTER